MEELRRDAGTVVGLVLDAGLILGADCKGTSLSGTISEVRKIWSLGHTVGAAGLGKSIPAEELRKYLKEYFEGGDRIEYPPGRIEKHKLCTIKGSVVALKQLVPWFHKYQGSLMIAGYDKIPEQDSDVPHLIVLSEECEISITETPAEDIRGRFCIGSGDRHAFTYIQPKYNRGMSLEDGIDLVERAIYFASTQDAYTGIAVEVLVITPDGCKDLTRKTIDELEEAYSR